MGGPAVAAFLLVLSTGLSLGQEFEVRLQQGTLIGTSLTTRNGRPFAAFLGFKYAQIPARFEDSILPSASDEIINATTPGDDCLQPNMGFNGHFETPSEAPFVGIEDCLFMNVYTPNLNPNKPLPVMYFIHGGGYELGSGSPVINGPEHLLDKDIVLVTVNYRLGPLGFFHAPERGIHGNIGLKDQTVGLLWVKKNIAAFGGDPNSVTIFGESAGASSVHLQMHSPLSKGLFHRAISQSGSLDCVWAISPKAEAQESAARFSLWIGCDIKSKEFKKCMQQKSVEEFILAYKKTGLTRYGLYIEFKPVIEEEGPDAFLTESSIKDRSSIPWMNGVNGGEGAFIVGFYYNEGDTKLELLNDFLKLTLPYLANSYKFSDMPHLMTDRILHQYFGSKQVGMDTLSELIMMVGDYMFIHGHLKSNTLHRGPVYQYYLSHKAEKSFLCGTPLAQVKDPDHGEELFHLFHSHKFCTNITATENDMEVTQQFLDLFTNFAIYGDPTPPGSKYKWKPKSDGDMHFEFKPKTQGMTNAPFLERMPFWDQLSNDLASKKCPRSNEKHDEL